MSHYAEQREAFDAECAATKARIENITQSAEALVKEASQQRTTRALNGLVAAAERIAAAIERIAAIPNDGQTRVVQIDLAAVHSADWPDAPHPTPENLAVLFDDTRSRALIEAIKRVSWFGCTHRHDTATDELVMSITVGPNKFDKLADLLDMTPAQLLGNLACFPGYKRHIDHYSIRFPAAWVRSA